jgi:hypothetical protein
MAILELDGLRIEYDRKGSGPTYVLHSAHRADRVRPSAAALAATRRVTASIYPFGASTPTAFDSVADHADHVARVMRARTASVDRRAARGFGAFVRPNSRSATAPGLGSS